MLTLKAPVFGCHGHQKQHQRTPIRGVSKRSSQLVRSITAEQGPSTRHMSIDQQSTDATRRGVMLTTIAGLAGSCIGPARAEETIAATAASSGSFTSFTDPVDKFTLSLPTDWEYGEGKASGNSSFSGASGARRTLAWYPTGKLARDANVTVVVTNVSGEFTRLGSFGNVYAFGTNLVNSMDRSYLQRDAKKRALLKGKDAIQVAKLLEAKEIGDYYFVEYTVVKDPDARHLFSLIALGFNGRYNRLYSVTAQCKEDELELFRPTLAVIINSFKAPF